MLENRVLVIGLDGASWNILDPLIAYNKLPNLAKLLKAGISGPLRSTIPPVTAPAWVSFSTGVNPGKHGVFSFETHETSSGSTGFVSSRSVRAPRLWHLAGRQGKNVSIVNVPVTYPPEVVNGQMISGMLTPRQSNAFSYPPELQQEIASIAPGYVTDVNLLTGGRTFNTLEDKLTFIEEARQAMDARGILVKHLMKQHPWDLFISVFVTMDRIQHVLYRYLEPGESPPTHLEKVQQAIHQLYSDLDSVVGELVAIAGENATVVVMSDHGFGRLKSAVNINRWLQQHDLLAFKESRGDLRGWLMRLSQIVQWRRFVPERIRNRFRAPFDPVACINWKHTKAYSGSPIEQGIYINSPDRRSGGIVSDPEEAVRIKRMIKEQLPQLQDPETGQTVIKAVYDVSELMSGPHISLAPDLIYVPRESAYLTNAGTPDLGLFDRGDYWIDGGYHHPDGIVIVQGPNIKSGKKMEGAKIFDLAPTIMHLLDLPIPTYFDGCVLNDLFKEDYLQTHPVQVEDKSDFDWEHESPRFGEGETAFSEEESEMIRSRLRDLGYLD